MIDSGLKFTDNSAHTAVSPAGTNMQTGTVMVLVSFSDVANVLRGVVNRTGGAQNQSIFRRSADGTSIRVQIGRGAGTPQQVDTPAGGIVVNVPMQFAYQWDIASGGPTSYLTRVGLPLADTTTSPTNGSGTHDSTNATWQLGSSTSAGMVVWAFAVSNVRLTLAEMQQWFASPSPNFRGKELFWLPGMSLWDWTGKGLHATVTGAVPVPATAPLAGVIRRR